MKPEDGGQEACLVLCQSERRAGKESAAYLLCNTEVEQSTSGRIVVVQRATQRPEGRGATCLSVTQCSWAADRAAQPAHLTAGWRGAYSPALRVHGLAATRRRSTRRGAGTDSSSRRRCQGLYATWTMCAAATDERVVWPGNAIRHAQPQGRWDPRSCAALRRAEGQKGRRAAIATPQQPAPSPASLTSLECRDRVFGADWWAAVLRSASLPLCLSASPPRRPVWPLGRGPNDLPCPCPCPVWGPTTRAQ